MKKIFAVIVLALFVALSTVAFFSGSVLKANAEETVSSETSTDNESSQNEGENLPVTDETGTDEEIPTEDKNAVTGAEETPKPTITITEEELTELINSALTEQQKQFVDSVAGKIALALGLDHNIVYLACAVALIIILVIIVLVANVFKGKGALKTLSTQLKAQQSAYAVLSDTKEDLQKALQNLTAKDIANFVKVAYSEQADNIVKDVSCKVVDKLKLDENTISEVLGNEKVLVEQVKILSDALIAIASNNRDQAINILSKAPTQDVVNTLALENEKLKSALGEKAVAETLGTKTTATETETDKKGA